MLYSVTIAFMNKIILTTLLALGISNMAYSEGFSYDYIDTGIIRYNFKSPTNSWHYEGYLVSASKSASKNVYLLGAYKNLERTNGDTHNATSIGIGVHYPINNSSDVIANYVNTNFDETYSSIYTTSPTGGRYTTIGLGIRHQFSDDLELNTNLERLDLANSPALVESFALGAIYKINNDLSLKFGTSVGSPSGITLQDFDTTEFGIRYNF